MWLWVLGVAFAHKPWVAGPDQYRSPDSALFVDELDVSIALYGELSCAAPALWVSFEAEPGERLFVQLGLPELTRQQDWRPSVAVIAAGLPAPDVALPFELPAGLGAWVFPTDAVDQPEPFFEPFSGTSSWILTTETVELPGGPGYVVAWDPAGLVGKLWVATGDRESFTTEDFERILPLMDEIRAFHEVEGEQSGPMVGCPAAAGAAGSPASGDVDDTGCGSGSAAFLLLSALPLRRRARSAASVR